MSDYYYDSKGIKHFTEWERDTANSGYLMDERHARLQEERYREQQERYLKQEAKDRQSAIRLQRDILLLENEPEHSRFDLIASRACQEFVSKVESSCDPCRDAQVTKVLARQMYELHMQQALCDTLNQAMRQRNENLRSRLEEMRESLKKSELNLEQLHAQLKTAQAAHSISKPFSLLGIALSKPKPEHLENSRVLDRLKTSLADAEGAVSLARQNLDGVKKSDGMPRKERRQVLNQFLKTDLEGFIGSLTLASFDRRFLDKVLDPFQAQLPPRLRVSLLDCPDKTAPIFGRCIAALRNPAVWESVLDTLELLDGMLFVREGEFPHIISGDGKENIYFSCPNKEKEASILQAIQDLRKDVGPEGARRILEWEEFAEHISAEMAAVFRNRLEAAGAIVSASYGELSEAKRILKNQEDDIEDDDEDKI
jgi:hypothetical protein